jgi:S1-C subfamily serine protease
MRIFNYSGLLFSVLLFTGPVLAQTEEGDAREAEQKAAEFERRMVAAEQRMAEAAREMAALSAARMPHIERIERHIEITSKPRLGVAIGGDDHKGPVEGVQIVAVTPGSAASEAGLRAGDVITSINTESISGSSAIEANQKLLDFMIGVDEGDALDVEYLRNGKVGKVEVMPKISASNVFIWDGTGDPDFDLRVIPGAPGVAGVAHVPGAPNAMVVPRFSWTFSDDGLGAMELVELNEGLGRYFGTDSGLLVVSVPDSNRLQLQEGDVIREIDGREPQSVRHGLQILGSYQAGEKLEITIMRDKKSMKLNIEMPDDRSSMLLESFPAFVRPASAPLPAVAPAPVALIERT